MRIKNRALLVLALLLTFMVAEAQEGLAQARQTQTPDTQPAAARRPAPSKPPIEFSVTYGSMWGGNLQFYDGHLRTGTGPSLGFAVDIPVQRGTWLEVSYDRQEGSLDWDPRGGNKTTLTDMTVNVWQLGAIRALGPTDGPIMPYVQGSLGATYMSPSESLITIGDEDFGIDSVTKFSIAFGGGFKAYVGESQKFGLRGSFKVISTLYDSGGGIYFGGGGASLGISGSGIWQFVASGGVTMKFGG